MEDHVLHRLDPLLRAEVHLVVLAADVSGNLRETERNKQLLKPLLRETGILAFADHLHALKPKEHTTGEGKHQQAELELFKKTYYAKCTF